MFRDEQGYALSVLPGGLQPASVHLRADPAAGGSQPAADHGLVLRFDQVGTPALPPRVEMYDGRCLVGMSSGASDVGSCAQDHKAPAPSRDLSGCRCTFNICPPGWAWLIRATWRAVAACCVDTCLASIACLSELGTEMGQRWHLLAYVPCISPLWLRRRWRAARWCCLGSRSRGHRALPATGRACRSSRLHPRAPLHPLSWHAVPALHEPKPSVTTQSLCGSVLRRAHHVFRTVTTACRPGLGIYE